MPNALRTGPSGDGVFDPELGGALSALAYRRGRAAPAGPVQADPARAAAARFDDILEARGVVVRGVPRTGIAAPGLGRIAALEVFSGRMRPSIRPTVIALPRLPCVVSSTIADSQ